MVLHAQMNLGTTFGAFLDPVADKVFSIALFPLDYAYCLQFWLVY